MSRPAPASLIRGPLLPAVLRLALPAVGTTLLQVLFNITDTFWVGRTLGPAALAGVSSASYALWIIITTGELLGVHIVGPEATEMIHEFAVGRTLEATLEEIIHTIHAHPTLSEAALEATLAALGHPIHI